jgi:phage-related protein
VGSAKHASVLFCFHEGFAVVLHGFIKKTRQTPSAELEVARTRMKEIEQ